MRRMSRTLALLALGLAMAAGATLASWDRGPASGPDAPAAVAAPAAPTVFEAATVPPEGGAMPPESFARGGVSLAADESDAAEGSLTLAAFAAAVPAGPRAPDGAPPGNIPTAAALRSSLARRSSPAIAGDFARMLLSRLHIQGGDASASPWAKTAADAPPLLRAAWRLGLLPSGGAGPAAGGARLRPADLRRVATALQDAGLAPRRALAARDLVRGMRGDVTRGDAEDFLDALLSAEAGDPAGTAELDGWTFPVKASWTMRATAYGRSEPGIGTTTATGRRVREGIAAVDPRLVPLGSLLYVEGYGFAVAADTGGAIRGLRIDLYLDGPASRIASFGVRERRVYLIALPR